jgi:hypothetical protein
MMKTKEYILIQILFTATLLSAQVDIEIANGMLVEMTAGLVVEISGDVVENGSGYLNGVVTSGVRGAIAQFAGLTLSSPFDGKITRTTGKQYPGTNASLTRYYEVDNHEGSDLIANVTTVTTTAENESLTGPFFHYTKNGSNWKGYNFDSSGTTIVSYNVLFPQNSVTDLIISGGVGVKAKIFLEGPYNATNHNMNNSINDIIPLTSPYSTDRRTVSNIPSTAVDWVLVQLRDPTTPSTVIASRSAFLNTDGNIIDDDSTLGIGIAALRGDYYIVIKHRNHLAIMSANKVTLPNTTTYDFTVGDGSQFYPGDGRGAKEIEPGVWGMIAGDGNASGSITASDYNSVWLPQFLAGEEGYKSGDYNLNGEITASDNNSVWLINFLLGGDTQIPSVP